MTIYWLPIILVGLLPSLVSASVVSKPTHDNSKNGWPWMAYGDQDSDGSPRTTESMSLVQLKRAVATESRFLNQKSHRHARKVAKAHSSPTPAGISPLDLWAIHDLLLLGHKGPLIQDNVGRPLVQAAAESLGGLLSDIHPIPQCRVAVAAAATLSAKAKATWSCLGLSKANFTGAFVSEKKSHFVDAANTMPNFDKDLGACAGSKWPRGCSYWASMHAMGVRADAFQKAGVYFQAILRIISGGALYCFGCTSHWRVLNKYLLPPELRSYTDLTPY